MKRYIFLMLAFFLSFNQAFAIGISAPCNDCVEKIKTYKQARTTK
ncbi:hypothetical protein C8D79_0374 [Bacteriovorax stolpii]|nr:hypothetical protein [Bacteriovorax stolpii]TDP55327.1 hypothetical protein C8D79_0374 [Bacteriovorax stolpii]